MFNKLLTIFGKLTVWIDKIPDGNIRIEAKAELKKAEILLRTQLTWVIGIVVIMIFANYFIKTSIDPEYLKKYKESIDLVLLAVGVTVISGIPIKEFLKHVKDWRKKK